MKRFFAFTLAETLIVMGIIGIVSALTLPNLNASTGEKEKVAKVKKIYQNLNDAYGRAVSVYGPSDEWLTLDSNKTAQVTRVGDRITEFLKISKNCGVNANQGCFPKQTYYLGKDPSHITNIDNMTTEYKVIIADGASIGFYLGYQNSDVIMIDIDIDGPNKGSSTYGIDQFLFEVQNSTVYPRGYSDNLFASNFQYSDGYLKGGVMGTAWIINYDNMDYIKLDTSGKYPNGTVPTEQNPRCKEKFL